MTSGGFDFGFLTRCGFPLESYEAGETVFLKDDDGECMYVVHSGRIAIVSAGTVLDNIGPGGVFGEMALIDGAPRSASAIAHEASEITPVDGAAFRYLVQQNPDFALEVMRVMAKRLRRMTESL